MQEELNEILKFLETAGWQIVNFLFVLILGLVVIKLIAKILIGIFLRSPLDNTVGSFLVSVTKFALYLILTFILVDILSIPLTSFVAILGTAGLAVGLALQGSLSNLASGVVIILTKPFKEGDFVDINGVQGVVKSIKMLNTVLVTTDNKKSIVPNSTIVNSNMTNYNGRATRRVDINFFVSYDVEIDRVKEVIMSVVDKHEMILKNPPPTCRMSEQAASSLKFTLKVYTESTNYWDVYYDLNEQVFNAFRANNIVIPYNQLDVHVK